MWTILITAATLACDASDSVDLTHTTLPTDYPTITCIPANLYAYTGTYVNLANMTALRVIKKRAFQLAVHPTSTIDLRNAANLTTVGLGAFDTFNGAVHMENNAALISIGPYAFFQADNTVSTIDLTNAAKLTTVDNEAFSNFKGVVRMENNAALKTIGGGAFYQADNPTSTIDLTNAVALATVDNEAFHEFKGVVRVVGRYPLLENIKDSAFANAQHLDNTVNIECVAANFVLGDNVFNNTTWTTKRIIETDCSLIPPPSPPAPSPVSAPAPSGSSSEGASGSSAGLIAGASVAGVVVLGGGYAVFKFVSAKATSGSGFNYLLF